MIVGRGVWIPNCQQKSVPSSFPPFICLTAERSDVLAGVVPTFTLQGATEMPTSALESINDIFAALKSGAVDGRMVQGLGLISASTAQATTRVGASA